MASNNGGIKFMLTASRSSAFLMYVSINLRISFFTVRNCRTFGVLVAILPVENIDEMGHSITSGKETRTFTGNCFTDDSAHCLVKTEHIKEYTSHLGQIETSDRCTSRD